jgi:ATP-dependent RNA helicase DOB1
VSGDGTLSVHDLRAAKALARSEDDADDELLSGEGGHGAS